MSRIVILGSGMAGFRAWHRLRDEPRRVVLYDKHPHVGGHTYSWVFPPGFENYEDWLISAYGETFAREFPERYTVKYHTTNSRNLTTDWIGPRMYRASLEEMLCGAMTPAAPNVHYITGFRYPKLGGFVEYSGGFSAEATICLDREVVAIDPAARRLRFADGCVEGYDGLVSSIPLPDLAPLLGDAPVEVQDAARQLSCSICVLVNIGVGRVNISHHHIGYFYDEDIVFSRLSFSHLMAAGNVPDGCGSVQAEIYVSDKYRPLKARPEDYIEQTISDLRRCGIPREDDDVLYKGAMLLPHANVICDHDRVRALERIHGYLDEVGIAWCGRYGDWGHIWTDKAFTSGERAAERAIAVASVTRTSLPVALAPWRRGRTIDQRHGELT